MRESWIAGSLKDRDGFWDIAYVSLAGLAVATVGPIFLMTAMSMVAHFRCTPAVYVVKDVLTVVSCPYDPQPLGTAIGLACGGFGVALGALAAYMAATRRPAGASTTTTTTKQETVVAAPTPQPPPAALPAGEPLEVSVIAMPKPEGSPNGKAETVKPKAKARGSKTKH